MTRLSIHVIGETPAARGEPRCSHTDGPHHDCRYVGDRNRLIPAAELEANRSGFEGRDPRWTRVFMAAMDRMAAEKGLTSGLSPSTVRAEAAEREASKGSLPRIIADFRAEHHTQTSDRYFRGTVEVSRHADDEEKPS